MRTSDDGVGAMRLGLHHFAYLRAIAMGLDRVESARRYLAIDHAASAVTAHRLVVERLRALTRRRGDRRWRLVGLSIPVLGAKGSPGEGGEHDAVAPPTLAEWAEAHGLEDWGEAELQVLYTEAFPVTDRTAARNQRMRERQRALLFELEQLAAETPQPTDLVLGWFEDAVAKRLIGAGWITLGDLRQRIARGGRWWRGLSGVGAVKAARLAAYLETLLPSVPTGAHTAGFHVQAQRAWAMSAAADRAEGEEGEEEDGAAGHAELGFIETEAHQLLTSDSSSNRSLPTAAGIHATDDPQAINAWIAAKAGGAATARSYRKEAERLLVWCLLERHKPLSSMDQGDCLAYLTFLEHLPETWISLRHARRHEPGWTPFRGPLSTSSRRYALVVLSGLFDWLVSARYLTANPWRLVNRKIADDRFAELDSRAFTPQAWDALHAFLASSQVFPSSARDRIAFLLAFGEATGLRASELVSATLGDFRKVNRGWVLQVQGKGGKARVVAVPGQAAQAVNQYLKTRGIAPLGSFESVHGELPLVASALDPEASVSYSALYRSLKSWLHKAVWASNLMTREKLDLGRASLHWLRHTCGTRALERSVPLEVVQRQLGHADPRTTMRYAKPQLERLQAEMEKGFG